MQTRYFFNKFLTLCNVYVTFIYEQITYTYGKLKNNSQLSFCLGKILERIGVGLMYFTKLTIKKKHVSPTFKIWRLNFSLFQWREKLKAKTKNKASESHLQARESRVKEWALRLDLGFWGSVHFLHHFLVAIKARKDNQNCFCFSYITNSVKDVNLFTIELVSRLQKLM